jgi:hypothetical protein
MTRLTKETRVKIEEYILNCINSDDEVLNTPEYYLYKFFI